MFYFLACGSTQVGFDFELQGSSQEREETISEEDGSFGTDAPEEPTDTDVPEEDSGTEAHEEAELVIPEDPFCPVNMVSVRDDLGEPVYCIDIFEISTDDGDMGNKDQGEDWPDGSTTAAAISAPDVLPAIFFSWYQAAALCENAGKYLCSSEEWTDACDGQYGPGGNSYPYGDLWISGECATLIGEEEVYSYVQPTGSHPGCVSDWGTYDQIGNAWEWTDPMQVDDGGLPVTNKVGASYYSGGENIGCSSSAVADHPPDFGGEISARCCASPSFSE